MKIAVKLTEKVEVKFTKAGIELIHKNLAKYKDIRIHNWLLMIKEDEPTKICLCDLIFVLKTEYNNRNYVFIKGHEFSLNIGFWRIVKSIFKK